MKQYLYDECLIENRQYGTAKQTELLLFKGNDVNLTDGYDRIRLKGANILFYTFSTTTTDKTTESTKILIDINGNVGIGTINPNNILQVGDGARLRISNSVSDYSVIGTKNVDDATNT